MSTDNQSTQNSAPPDSNESLPNPFLQLSSTTTTVSNTASELQNSVSTHNDSTSSVFTFQGNTSPLLSPNKTSTVLPKSIDPALLNLDPSQQAAYLSQLAEQQYTIGTPSVRSTMDSDSEELEDGDEEEDEKRQQRLAKNRKSAAVSRAKKKQYVVELEIKLDRLNAMNEEMEKKLQKLVDENTNLQEKVETLQETLNKCANFSTILQDLHKLQQSQQLPTTVATASSSGGTGDKNDKQNIRATEMEKTDNGDTLKAGLAKLLVFLKEMLDE
jgi:vacuolar-type H+-ATPase subunit I/STV1